MRCVLAEIGISPCCPSALRIVHGDMKPDNLLFSSSGKVKISDFGSARFCEASDTIFASAGTPAFMAPEMCMSEWDAWLQPRDTDLSCAVQTLHAAFVRQDCVVIVGLAL